MRAISSIRERPFRCERNIVLLSEKGRFSVREKPASSLELEAEADDEGQVVAEAALVAVAIIGAEGFDAAVLFVLFKKEGGIIDVSLRD